MDGDLERALRKLQDVKANVEAAKRWAGDENTVYSKTRQALKDLEEAVRLLKRL